MFRKMIQECQNVPDQWKKFRSEREKVNNKTDQQIRLCLYISKVKFRNIPCDCPPPCSERQMQVTHQYYKPHYLTKDWEIYFNFQSKMVTHVREFPSYTISKFLSDIGGALGLFVGMSCLSVLEIVVFVALKMKHYVLVLHDKLRSN